MIEYKVIASDIRNFEKEVNRALKDGWKLHGSPTSVDQRMIQALTKEIKTTTKSKK